MSNLLGIVVAPKTGELVLVYRDRHDRYVYLRNLVGEKIGSGWFHDDIHDHYGQSARITGFPRVHTAGGLVNKYREMGGYGTALYTSLCLAAHMATVSGQYGYTEPTGDGISSNDDRSESATEWWDSAKDKFDLAYREEGDIEEEDQEGSTSDSGGRRDSPSFADDLAESSAESSVDSGSVSDVKVTSWSYDIDYTYTKTESGEADAYPYSNAERASLIVADVSKPEDFGGDRPGLDEMDTDTLIETLGDVDPDVLARANYGLLKEYGERGQQAFQRIFAIGKHVGVPVDSLERMYFRFLSGIDGQFDYRKGIDVPAAEGSPYEYLLEQVMEGSGPDLPPAQKQEQLDRMDQLVSVWGRAAGPVVYVREALEKKSNPEAAMFIVSAINRGKSPADALELAERQFPFRRQTPLPFATPNRRGRKSRIARPNSFEMVRYGGGMRRNPEPREAQEEIERLGAERAELGWDRFADDRGE